MITDMTEGSPSKILWQFSLPLLLSVIFQQFYNIVDSIVAGKFINMEALAAVGASYPITMLFIAFANGSNIGCSVIISQLFGEKNYKNLKTAISTSLISIIILSLVLTILGLVYCSKLMIILSTPEDVFSGTETYLKIYLLGLIFLFLYNICTGIFTALGDSKTPLYFLIASSVANIILDLIFVIVFKMGISGVAWATFLAQGISSLLVILTLFKKIKTLKTPDGYKKFSFHMLAKISIVAIPSICQQSFVSVGNLFVQGLVNSFGSFVIAGYSSALKLNTFALTCFNTISNSISSFTAQNLGAKKIERIKEGFKAGMKMMIYIVIPFIIAFFVFSRQFITIFMDSSEVEAINVGVKFLKIVSPFYIVVAIKIFADGVLRGSSSMICFMIATFSDLILRVIFSFILVDILKDSTGIWLSWPVGWTIGAILSMGFYLSGIWKRRWIKKVNIEKS